MNFADSIVKLRSELRLSQRQLADNLKVNFATVNRWENGKTIPNRMTMFVIHQYCADHNIEFGYQEEPATSQGKAFLESSIKKSRGE